MDLLTQPRRLMCGSPLQLLIEEVCFLMKDVTSVRLFASTLFSACDGAFLLFKFLIKSSKSTDFTVVIYVTSKSF